MAEARARPTGQQHVGNYLDAIRNYVALQAEYDCIYCIVDLHALTTMEATESLRANTREMALDWLAADIALVRPRLVRVGVDQAPHIEFTREVVGSFNFRNATEVLVKPDTKVTEIPKVLGTDGQQKMSKSLNNHIELAATPEETTRRVMTMVTDPRRLPRTGPGDPDVCNVFSMHKIYSGAEEVAMINAECRTAGIGCVDCKQRFSANLNRSLEPFRERRAQIARDPDYV